MTGVYGVAESTALKSSGEGTLVLEKQKGMLTEGNHFTFAIAVSATAMRGGHIEIVGAGPGDPELISVRGKRMLEKADLVLYAGSLVPRELTFYAKEGATVRSSAGMDLEEQFALMKKFYDKGLFIVRLHTGDPCIYGAIQEQMAFFDRYKMSYHITPGISSFQAAAAALRSQFTIPEKVQSIILTRGEGRTPMPEKEQLHKLAQSQSTMCIYLSAGIVEQVQEELMQAYPPETPVAACYKLTWKEEKIYRGELKDLAKIVRDNNLTLTTLLVVGEAIDNRKGLSRLYAHEFKHLFRSKKRIIHIQPMILILGGTTEGRTAVKVADEAGKPYFYSTKGEWQEIQCKHGIRITGGMNTEKMESFCRQNDIRLLVDAAHPFASQLHRTVDETSRTLHLPVIRFERKYPPRTENIIWCEDYTDAIYRLEKAGTDHLLALTGVQTIGKLRLIGRNIPVGSAYWNGKLPSH